MATRPDAEPALHIPVCTDLRVFASTARFRSTGKVSTGEEPLRALANGVDYVRLVWHGGPRNRVGLAQAMVQRCVQDAELSGAQAISAAQMTVNLLSVPGWTPAPDFSQGA